MYSDENILNLLRKYIAKEGVGGGRAGAGGAAAGAATTGGGATGTGCINRVYCSWHQLFAWPYS